MADAVAAEGLDNLKAFHIEDQKWRKLQLESVLHRKRVFVPKVDPQNPFRAETQLMDQYELRELNRVRVCLAPRPCLVPPSNVLHRLCVCGAYTAVCVAV